MHKTKQNANTSLETELVSIFSSRWRWCQIQLKELRKQRKNEKWEQRGGLQCCDLGLLREGGWWNGNGNHRVHSLLGATLTLVCSSTETLRANQFISTVMLSALFTRSPRCPGTTVRGFELQSKLMYSCTPLFASQCESERVAVKLWRLLFSLCNTSF